MLGKYVVKIKIWKLQVLHFCFAWKAKANKATYCHARFWAAPDIKICNQ